MAWNLAQPLRHRVQAWWLARHRRSDQWQLSQRNLYILPSRPGLFFCATLLVLLLASINEQLSLGYLLTFLLGGAGLASMHSTHGNLQGLKLELKAPEPVFAGDDVQLELRLHNDDARPRWGVGLAVQPQRLSSFKTASEFAWTDVPARDQAPLQLRFASPARGHHPLPALQIMSRFPLGLFRAWSVWRPAAGLWVYPQPERSPPPFPESAGGGEGQAQAQTRALRQAGLELDGVRGYQRGDSMRQVLWKKAALSLDSGVLGAPLWVRDSQALASQELWLDWRDTAGLADEEQRLSRLCAWLLAAEALQRPYGLRLDGQEWPPALGPAQQQACLRALARHGQTETLDAPHEDESEGPA
ncbi:DUF58 domain-containing protein [Paucibacter aquatile]|uniref:DUF58 domain-containing protein n=1 Tax=Kinneretia aquatilis TaxID=2070761 RepID=A0A2N8KSC1_9BURK|nr:DUF58 domain-containing protein [Paucibacter aquatile]PND36330.1 DUF58 domain-containing protein [Paucibacter aquatile]